jgi:hypothetical protein
MRKQKTVAALAMTAALAGGAMIGTTMGNPLASGAQDNPTTTTTAPADGNQPGKGDHGPGGRMGPGVDLEVAAKTLGMSTDELRTQLQDGKSLADIAKAQGVDKQKLIDALVAAGDERLDEAKAALPDRIAAAVDATHPMGEGGFGGPGHGGPGGPGASLETAAKALGISEDDLKSELQDGKTIADVAKEKGVDEQKVIDALVAEAKARSAEAVKAGKITQEQADEHLKDLADRITKMVEDGFPKGGPRGGHGPRGGGEGGDGTDGTMPAPPGNGEGTTTTPSFGGGN